MLTRLAGCGIKSTGPIFKIKILICQSKANFDVNILFGNSTHLLNPKLGKCF